MMTNKLTYFEEPRIEFGYSQTAEDSRDGLTLFGPFEAAQGEARMGVIGTSKGIEAYEGFVSEVNKPIFTTSAGRPFFPGFHSGQSQILCKLGKRGKTRFLVARRMRREAGLCLPALTAR